MMVHNINGKYNEIFVILHQKKFNQLQPFRILAS